MSGNPWNCYDCSATGYGDGTMVTCPVCGGSNLGDTFIRTRNKKKPGITCPNCHGRSTADYIRDNGMCAKCKNPPKWVTTHIKMACSYGCRREDHPACGQKFSRDKVPGSREEAEAMLSGR